MSVEKTKIGFFSITGILFSLLALYTDTSGQVLSCWAHLVFKKNYMIPKRGRDSEDLPLTFYIRLETLELFDKCQPNESRCLKRRLVLNIHLF